MVSFINDVLADIQKKQVDISQLTFILPSKRAGHFLKNCLAQMSKETILSPDIISIEEFVENISQLKSISNTELLFQFYDVYVQSTPKDVRDDFDVFSKWAQIIIQDFNEIDRYLIPQESLFNYLSAIKEVNHWSLQDDQTDLVKNYLFFWKKLPQYYNALKQKLIENGLAYQGLIYREAVEKLEHYTSFHNKKKHIFLGFNALNASEQVIIKELLSQGLGDIYWDIDGTFINSEYHDAGLFIRKHKQWNHFKQEPFKWEANHYLKEKNIHAIGVPKKVGQAKYVGELLKKLKHASKDLKNTALVLGDEALLTPIINSIPSDINAVNITMGLPLHSVSLSSLFEDLFKLHKSYTESKIYYKSVISIISNAFIRPLLDKNPDEDVSIAISHISKNNMTYINLEELQALFVSSKPLINALFKSWQNNAKIGLQNSIQIIQFIKSHLNEDKDNHLLSLEYLYKFFKVFNQLSLLLERYSYVKEIQTLYNLYREIITVETLDFKGEPLQGLQIIGVLESRVIDFETVIITSVNEGVLPSGKSNNSFIPFDVKLEYGLPTYKEKDAVYAYHFYHLLQRAKNVYILYNTEIDALQGGEKSRFITQLEVEDIHNVKQYTISPKVPPTEVKPRVISKTEGVLQQLKELSFKGFSPSSLTSYVRNPLDFYNQKILNINTFDNVEESVAANTLGTILHNALETLYIPFIGDFLKEESIKNMQLKVDEVVLLYFKKEYKEGDITTGKNLIIFEIAKRYVSNFLNNELASIKNGDQIKIIALEKKMKVSLKIQELGFPVYLKGTVDRIDECNGTLRIIDYKSGKVEQNKVEIADWEDLNTDYEKYSKTIQILTYAYMMHLSSPFKNPIEAGIISFKNLKSGLLKFGKKESARSRTKETHITQDTFDAFEIELKKLILEICNKEIDFVEKKV